MQLGGLIGDRMSIADDVVDGVADRLGLDSRPPWHTDRAPVIDIVNAVTDLARWAAKVAVDIAHLVQLGEITTRAGGSSAAAGKRNPIDAMRATAAAEACLGVATVVLHAKPHELERGLGSWHAEWFAAPAGVPNSRRGHGGDRRCARLARGRAVRAGRWPTTAASRPMPTSPQSWSNRRDLVRNHLCRHPHRLRDRRPSMASGADPHPLAGQRPPHVGVHRCEALKSQYFIVAIDNVGHGQSDVPAGDYSVSDFADAVLAVADAAELERFHYCGLSVGGLTGQWLGAHHADRLLSLTLSNTAAEDRHRRAVGRADPHRPHATA